MSHPSNDVAANIELLFAVPTVDDAAKQAKLDALATSFKALANGVVSTVCVCTDRAASLEALRSSYKLAADALVYEPADPSPSWPPLPL